jgi:hypothetical protein
MKKREREREREKESTIIPEDWIRFSFLRYPISTLTVAIRASSLLQFDLG